jgi:hypothetical protein
MMHGQQNVKLQKQVYNHSGQPFIKSYKVKQLLTKLPEICVFVTSVPRVFRALGGST